jgi:nucleotide-binding universal stress UspA family protein
MTSDSGTGQYVVVGVDGSPESVAALNWAGAYAAATGATVRAIRAWHFPNVIGFPPEEKAPAAVTEQIKEQQQQELNEAVAKARLDPSAQVETGIVYGHPAEALIDESSRASLLVVGHRGHGGFQAMLTGSISIHCVNHANCPVVVVRGT